MGVLIGNTTTASLFSRKAMVSFIVLNFLAIQLSVV